MAYPRDYRAASDDWLQSLLSDGDTKALAEIIRRQEMGNFQPFHQPPEKCEHGVKPELCVLCERQSQQQFSHELGKFGVGGPEELPKEAHEIVLGDPLDCSIAEPLRNPLGVVGLDGRWRALQIDNDGFVRLSQSDVDRIAEAAEKLRCDRSPMNVQYYNRPSPTMTVVADVEIEADAKRYRWLKGQAETTLCAIAYRSHAACQHELADDAIDAAMADPNWR